MNKNYVVGNVVSVDGLKITILMNEQSNLESFHYNGVIYDGISIGSYVSIIRGSNKIIGRVEKEFLVDKEKEPSIREFSKDRFERHLEVTKYCIQLPKKHNDRFYLELLSILLTRTIMILHQKK